MRNVFITTIAALAFAGAAQAEEAATSVVATPVLTGEVALDFAETAAGDMAGTMGIDLGVDAAGLATVDLDFEVDEDGNGSLADWTVGTTVAGLGVAFGTDNGVMPGAEGEQTLAAPAMTESVQVTVGDAAVALGFTDWNTDITDISNVQGAYTMNVANLDVTAAADYNLDSENTVLGAGVGGLDLGLASIGGAMTYDVDAEKFGYETVATAMGVTAYLNGDDTDMLQNIGGEYEVDVNGATFTAGANYNIDTEDFAPTAGLSFNF
jgi:hypothetical protein